MNQRSKAHQKKGRSKQHHGAGAGAPDQAASTPHQDRTEKPPRETSEKRAWNLLAAAIAAAGVAAVIWSANIQRQQSAEQFAIANRPDVQATGARVTRFVAGERVSVEVVFENVGTMTAVDVMVAGAVQFGATPLFPNINYVALDGPRVTLGPQKRLTVMLTSDEPLSAQVLRDMQQPQGMTQLKAHGEIVFTTNQPPSIPLKHPHFCFVQDAGANQLTACDNFGDHADKGVFR